MKYWAAFAVMTASAVVSLFFIQHKRIDFKDKKLYFKYLFSLFLFILNFELTPSSFRIVGNMILFVFIAFLIFKKDLKKSCILGLFLLFINMISELIYVGISNPIIEQELFIMEEKITVFVQNFFVGIILMAISYFIGLKKWYYRLLKAINRINLKSITIFALLSIVLFNFLIWMTYFLSRSLYNNDLFTLAGSVISIFCAIFLFIYLKTSSNYKEVTEKYDLSLQSIEEYEKLIDTAKLNNHETRNQFLIIRNMTNNKKVTNYIDTLLDNKINDNEQLLVEVSRLPRCGLRGLIYSKLLAMKEKKINYNLLIDKKISMAKFSKIEDSLIVDICKILGVFLDNSIEAVENLDEKDIIIEIYADKNDIVCSVTNNFEGMLEVEDLDNLKYSTKGKGRGYGLMLVNEIVNKSNKLEKSTEIFEDNFTQNLKIKM